MHTIKGRAQQEAVLVMCAFINVQQANNVDAQTHTYTATLSS